MLIDVGLRFRVVEVSVPGHSLPFSYTRSGIDPPTASAVVVLYRSK